MVAKALGALLVLALCVGLGSERQVTPPQQPEDWVQTALEEQPPPSGRPSASGWRWDPEASWYGPGFYGNRTACGLAYTKRLVGVAHRSLKCGTLIDFRNPENGRVVLRVPVIDRGPYVDDRIWDLSGGLCLRLDHCYTGPIQWRFSSGGPSPARVKPLPTPPATDS